jgi:probable phosphoglycerate mutase
VELILVRHARPERIEHSEDHADPALTDLGRRQAERLARYLAEEPISAVYSSPYTRARETAEPLAVLLGLAVTVVDDVAEWDRTSTEYLPVEELRAAGDERLREVTSDVWRDLDLMLPFRRRVVDALDGLIAAHPGQRIVVACHAGVINVYLGEVLGLPIDRRGFHYPNYTSVHRVAASRSGVRTVVTINETAHLRNTGLLEGLIQRS